MHSAFTSHNFPLPSQTHVGSIKERIRSTVEEELPKQVEIDELREIRNNPHLKVAEIDSDKYTADLHSILTQLRTPKCEHIASVKAILRYQETICIASEHCGRSLPLLHQEASEEQVKIWALQIIDGLQVLQSCGAFLSHFSHRNIQLKEDCSATGSVVLSDYVSLLLSNDCFVRRQMCGMPGHVAPEELEQMDSTAEKQTVWYFGAVLCYLLTGNYPFPAEAVTLMQKVQAQGLRFDSCPVSLAAEALLCDLLQVTPSKRLSLDEARNHFFFTQASVQQSVEEGCAGPSSASWRLEKGQIRIAIEGYKQRDPRVALAAYITLSRNTEKCMKRNSKLCEFSKKCEKELTFFRDEILDLQARGELAMLLQDAENTLITEAKQVLLTAIRARDRDEARSFLRTAQVLLTVHGDAGASPAGQELIKVCGQLEYPCFDT